MTQERMHPEDLRAIVAALLAPLVGDITTGDIERALSGSEALLLALKQTAKPEAESNADLRIRLEMERAYKNADLRVRLEMERADRAEARVKELEERLGTTASQDEAATRMEEIEESEIAKYISRRCSANAKGWIEFGREEERKRVLSLLEKWIYEVKGR